MPVEQAQAVVEQATINPWILLTIGMVTVFFTLIIVVFVGNLIIRFVNKYLPEKVVEKVKVAKQTVNSAISNNKLAAIVTAVDVATKGKGRVVSVEKK